MHFVRQLLPVAVLFGFLGVLSGGISPALGNITSISPVSNGSTITITAVYTNSPAGTGASVTAAGNGAFTAATAVGAPVQVAGIGTKEITASPDSSGNTSDVITIQATFTCQGNGPVSFLLLQIGGTPNNQSASANCAGNTSTGTTGSTGSLIINPNTQSTGGNVTINGTCSPGSTLAAAPDVGKFILATVNGAALNVSGSSVTCVNGGSLSATYQCTQNGNTTMTLTGTTGGSGSLACGTAVGNVLPNQTTNSPILVSPNNAGTSSPVTIAISPELIPCGGTAQISVSASLIAGGPVQDGTTVNLYTTSGLIEPKIGVIKDGKFITTLKAPMAAGVATVNASVGSITNSRDVKFDCTISAGSTTNLPLVASTPFAQPQTSSPPPPPPLPPGAFPQGTGGIPIIAPPNTGDAGLRALLD